MHKKSLINNLFTWFCVIAGLASCLVLAPSCGNSKRSDQSHVSQPRQGLVLSDEISNDSGMKSPALSLDGKKGLFLGKWVRADKGFSLMGFETELGASEVSVSTLVPAEQNFPISQGFLTPDGNSIVIKSSKDSTIDDRLFLTTWGETNFREVNNLSGGRIQGVYFSLDSQILFINYIKTTSSIYAVALKETTLNAVQVSLDDSHETIWQLFTENGETKLITLFGESALSAKQFLLKSFSSTDGLTETALTQRVQVIQQTDKTQMQWLQGSWDNQYFLTQPIVSSSTAIYLTTKDKDRTKISVVGDGKLISQNNEKIFLQNNVKGFLFDGSPVTLPNSQMGYNAKVFTASTQNDTLFYLSEEVRRCQDNNNQDGPLKYGRSLFIWDGAILKRLTVNKEKINDKWVFSQGQGICSTSFDDQIVNVVVNQNASALDFRLFLGTITTDGLNFYLWDRVNGTDSYLAL